MNEVPVFRDSIDKMGQILPNLMKVLLLKVSIHFVFPEQILYLEFASSSSMETFQG